MSFLDKLAAAVTPTASEEDREKARADAQALATKGDWLDQILHHHRQIDAAFERAMHASGAGDRMAAVKQLATLLTGHSLAEEVVIYPTIADASSKSHATTAYEEQSMAKVQLAKLETLDPMGQEWRDKLEHVKGAVQQHVYQEESDWFPALARDVPATERDRLSERYREEAQRYFGAQELA